VNQPASKDSVRPTVLLVGDRSARPTGLEQALTRAGFQLLEQENGDAPQTDAILVTLAGISDTSAAALITGAESNGSRPPRFVVLSTSDPDGPAAALALGATDALAAPVHLPELCARLLVRIRERRSANGQELAFLAQRVKEEFERARRYSLSFSLILLSIDDLGASAERNGSDATGQLRVEVARTLRRELRAPDLVAPFSPDEFAIVLPETGEAGARQSVFRLRERLTSLPFEGDPRLEPTRFSAGIVTYPHPAALETDDLFAMAEAALMRGRAQAGERIGIAI
jgi:diguanylate cyclase (GGDEF)-like protein